MVEPTRPAPKVAAPAVARPVGFVAVGTIIHHDPVTGERTIIEHGHPLDLPSEHVRKLHRQGAALRGNVPMPPPPGVHQEPGYVLDEETGLWIDAQGATHGDAQPDIVAKHRAGQLEGPASDE